MNEEELKKGCGIYVAEFMKGTGSFTKECEKYGIKCWTTDINPKCNSTLTKDILHIVKEDIPKGVNVLWFSTPCDQYSHAKRRGERNLKYADDCAKKCLEIIDWFPNAIYFIENPQTGLLKTRDFMKGLSYFDVSYCKYGLPYRKQTRIWTNFRFWIPKNICKRDCEFMNNGKHLMSVGNGRLKYTIKGMSLNEKYKVPEELCSEIIQAILSSCQAKLEYFQKGKLEAINKIDTFMKQKTYCKESGDIIRILPFEWEELKEQLQKEIGEEKQDDN